jgi:hypothetical protein
MHVDRLRGVLWFTNMNFMSRCSRPVSEMRQGAAAVEGIAVGVAVAESRPDVPQIASANRLAAQHAEGLPKRRSAVHQYEPHVAPPNEKQKTVSELEPLGGGAQR